MDWVSADSRAAIAEAVVATWASAWLTSNLPLCVTVDGMSARWQASSDLLETVKGSFGSGREESVFMTCVEPRLLVLDDMGTEHQTDWTRSVIYRLVEKRLCRLHFTFITTTLQPEEWWNIDARLASRLSLFRQVACSSDDDLRRTEAARAHVGGGVTDTFIDRGTASFPVAESEGAGGPSSLVCGPPERRVSP
jgi:DNA replication protein DnaC